jgi:hypothetical protein
MPGAPMVLPSLPLIAILTALAASAGAALGAIEQGAEPVVRRLMVRDELIIHVPIRRRALPPIEWIERKGPKCLPAAIIAGASMAGPSAIDFVLRDRQRVRAELDSDCMGLDFYGGFYVEPEGDSVCAKRDEIRSRAGGSCRIERFRRLEPKIKH